MEIRKAEINDVPALAELFNDYRIFYGKKSDVDGARMFLTERISRRESEIFLSIIDSRTIGFTQLFPLFSSTRMKRLWLLNDLFVHPDFRGKGFSMALIERVMQHCRETGACGFTLETAKSNEIGNRLYSRMGLELDKDHNFYSWDV